MKKLSLLLLLVMVASTGSLFGIVWNGGWEARPAGTELASDIDLFITEFKREVGDRAIVEMIWGVTTDDNGLMRLGSARAFVQNTAPTDIDGPGQYNSTAGAVAGTLLTTDEIGTTTRDLGAGRLWVDSDGLDTGVATDDNQLNVWDETANAFVPVRATGVNPIHSNLIYNGSFEITDGTGDTASTSAPLGWTNLNTATLAYANPTGVSEGEGLALQTTAAGGDNEGVQQTIASLKASTTYVYRVRVNPTAGDTCNLFVDDGTTNVTATSVGAGGTFETLEVSHTTTAAPATVTVALRSTLDTDVCQWDHVTVVEANPVVAQPGSQLCFDTDNTILTNYGGGAMVAVPGLSCAVTIPGKNYAIVVEAQVSADNDDGGSRTLEAELLQDCGGGATAVATQFATSGVNAAASTQDNTTVTVRFVNRTPTVGATCIYTLQAASEATNMFSNDQDGDSNSSLADPFSSLSVELKALQ